jgi:hypothetical protein
MMPGLVDTFAEMSLVGVHVPVGVVAVPPEVVVDVEGVVEVPEFVVVVVVAFGPCDFPLPVVAPLVVVVGFPLAPCEVVVGEPDVVFVVDFGPCAFGEVDGPPLPGLANTGALASVSTIVPSPTHRVGVRMDILPARQQTQRMCRACSEM